MKINFDRAMIELIREIRKKVSPEAKPKIKFANPEIFDELKVIYNKESDVILKALIKELFTRAGDKWLEKLEPASSTATEKSDHQTKVYRGQTMLVEKRPKDTSTKKKRTRVYRGQVVEF
ncbi:hypothetical protein [Marinibactrum halimedae]|uniref:Uncharacterized protein n=1 Tax=Marinibactrum halimedae TaxID=1444977 RepID=A0AA37WMG0_9GAMM|nr:hypothetical protein [Marinibactrum halimedae]MCD9458092.1 hypothetical protein [Marinibactrum halimedae]GLS25026.1 hypothetical protein GCM10007877_07400 [Marinibactrum halimedae]